MSFPPPTPRQAQLIWFAVTTLAVALTVAIVGAVVWGMGRVVSILSPVLWPLAVAGIIAFILDPVVDWLMKHRVPRLRAILLVFGAAALIVLGIFGSVVPRLFLEARDLAGRIPQYTSAMQERIQGWINAPSRPLLELLPASWQQFMTRSGVAARTPTNTAASSTNQLREIEAIETDRDRPAATRGGTNSVTTVPRVPGPAWWEKAVNPAALKTAGDWVLAMAPEVGQWVIGQLGRVASWIGVLAGLALIPIYAFYFLLEKRSIEQTWTNYVPLSDSKFRDEMVWLLRNINDSLIVFFRGQVLVAICDGVLYTIGFLLIGLPYALLLGLVATVLTIVPFLGAIVTCGTALIIAVVQYGDWQHPLKVLIVFAVVQGMEGWLIQPKIIGDRVGLHPVTIIIALLVGTTLMGGILGGLLAIPATAVIRALMFRYVWRTRSATAG